jgi:protein O-GlcNAc transferase
MAPINIKQSFDLAVQHHQAGRLQEAQTLYRQILAQQPTHAGAMHLLGVIAQQSGRPDIAIDLIRQAIARFPNFPDAFVNLGNILKSTGQFDQAIAAYRQAIALRPNCAEDHEHLANALHEAGRLDESIASHHHAIALNPNSSGPYSNLGNVLKEAGKLDESIAACRKAIDLNPNMMEAFNNLGNALRDKGQLDEAAAAYRRAVALNPNVSELHSNLASILHDTAQIAEALAEYRAALALRPGFAGVHSNLILAMYYDPACDAQAIAEEHRRWYRQHAQPLRKFIRPHSNDRDPARPLRVGYVSSDFREHSVSRFLLPLFRHHDHAAFRIVCYSDVPNEDAMTQNLRASVDDWRPIVGFTDERTAQQIRDDRIDILVDLAGHTARNHLRVFARKPAPVQVTYLGFPGTTGLPEIDYRLTDSLADPVEQTDSLHSEKLWPLPACNWCFAEPENSPAVRASRADGPICFGSFNNFAKVSPAVMELWAAILKATPSSRLIIKARGLSDPGIQQRITNFFNLHGLPPNRLTILGNLPDFRSHLEMYNQVDIALDTFPYHGTTTTCEALWMGVPVVTLAGQTHVSRVGVSLLTCVGLPDLIAQSPGEFVSFATALANDLPRLTDLRRTLRNRMHASPLMDAPAFARNIEAAYRAMWHIWCKST